MDLECKKQKDHKFEVNLKSQKKKSRAGDFGSEDEDEDNNNKMIKTTTEKTTRKNMQLGPHVLPPTEELDEYPQLVPYCRRPEGHSPLENFWKLQK